MKKLNEVVQYDFQRNTFYKVNKDTGIQSPTYRNGQQIKKFRPEVTGQHYLTRRKSQKTDIPEFPSRLGKQISLRTERLVPEYSYFKTLSTSNREYKCTETSMIMRSTISNSKRDEKYSSKVLKDNSFFKLQIQMQPAQLSKQKSNERLKKQLFNKTLTNYTKILKQKSKDNHSPKKDQYQGPVHPKDPLQTLCTTISHFKIREPVWENRGSITQRQIERQINLPKHYQSVKKQISTKERTLFLDYLVHPQYKAKVSPKTIEVQVQRKKNLKILEDLFIRQNNKPTHKIYKSIV